MVVVGKANDFWEGKMAKVTQVRVIDDYTQEEVQSEQAQQLDITINGTLYEMDLGPGSYASIMQQLQEITKNVRGVPLKRHFRRARRAAVEGRGPATTDREQSRAKREFWRNAYEAGLKLENGAEIPVPSTKGRIPLSVEELYERTGGVIPQAEDSTPESPVQATNTTPELDKEYVRTARAWAKKHGAKLPRNATPDWVIEAYDQQNEGLLQKS